MPVLEKVTRWLAMVDEVRAEQGVTAAKFGDATILSLIHVESGGDEWAHREDSQFWGGLQMGRMAGLDVGCEDLGRLTTRMLHGDMRNAIRMFIQYQERYHERTDYRPTQQAALWKGGPGTARSLRGFLDAGEPWPIALQRAADKHNIPNLVEYLRRFTEAFQSYSIWIDDLDVPYPRMCALPDEPPGRPDD